MNMEQANAISLPAILEKLGHLPFTELGSEIWFLSPLTNGKNPTFFVNLSNNTWLDTETSQSGSVMDLIIAYLKIRHEDHSPASALEYLKALLNKENQKNAQNNLPTSPKLTLRKISQLKHASLLHFLEKRGINPKIAKRYVQEVVVQCSSTDTQFYALGLSNEDGGFYIRNLTFKGHVGADGITVLRGKFLLPDTVHVFKSYLDFLSILTYQKENQMFGDVIILNSLDFLPQSLIYLKNYSYKTVVTWMDNNDDGLNATSVLKEFVDHHKYLYLKPMNKTYMPHRDVNAWHMNMQNL